MVKVFLINLNILNINSFKNYNQTNLDTDCASPTRILQHLEKLNKVHVTKDNIESKSHQQYYSCNNTTVYIF